MPNYQIVSMRIEGYLVGNIWMPDAECYKPLTYDLLDGNRMCSEKLTLREHVIRATNDGDFQSCRIADGVLSVCIARHDKGMVYTRKRHFDLNRFPSIDDCVLDDWDGPAFEE